MWALFAARHATGGYFEPSMQLIRSGSADGFGQHWVRPLGRASTGGWSELVPEDMPSAASMKPTFFDARGPLCWVLAAQVPGWLAH